MPAGCGSRWRNYLNECAAFEGKAPFCLMAGNKLSFCGVGMQPHEEGLQSSQDAAALGRNCVKKACRRARYEKVSLAHGRKRAIMARLNQVRKTSTWFGASAADGSCE